VLEFVKELLWPHRVQDSIPSLDGPWSPNDRLEERPVLVEGLRGPTALTADDTGDIYIATGGIVTRHAGRDWSERSTVAEFESAVHELSWSAELGLTACVSGAGVTWLGGGRSGRKSVETCGGQAIRCPTASLYVGNDTLIVAESSTSFINEDFRRDYLSHGASGRLIELNVATGTTRLLGERLRYPAGLALSPSGDALRFTESWRHRLVELPLGTASAPGRDLGSPLPGFPWSMLRTARGTWVTLFAMRTHLMEFVLGERRFRERMIATIDPAHWIAPVFQSTGHAYEPVQGGQLKQHGITKPWAPPRSYGLALRLEADGTPAETLHSRHGGKFHGLTSLCTARGKILALSRAAGAVIEVADHD
jgi:hypothetical protein